MHLIARYMPWTALHDTCRCLFKIPYCDDLAEAQRDVVQLRDEDAGHCFEQGGTVHVDSGSEGRHELDDPRIHMVLLFQASHCHRGNGDAEKARIPRIAEILKGDTVRSLFAHL